MTVRTIRIWHCDANRCEESAPEDTDGWTDTIYTHGCPEHGAEIEAHAALIRDETHGRGAREKTTWFLSCACGWNGGYSAWNYSSLQMGHLVHVKGATAKTVGAT